MNNSTLTELKKELNGMMENAAQRNPTELNRYKVPNNFNEPSSNELNELQSFIAIKSLDEKTRITGRLESAQRLINANRTNDAYEIYRQIQSDLNSSKILNKKFVNKKFVNKVEAKITEKTKDIEFIRDMNELANARNLGNYNSIATLAGFRNDEFEVLEPIALQAITRVVFDNPAIDYYRLALHKILNPHKNITTQKMNEEALTTLLTTDLKKTNKNSDKKIVLFYC